MDYLHHKEDPCRDCDTVLMVSGAAGPGKRSALKETLVVVPCVRVPPLFPVAPVGWVVSEFDLLDPFDPLVSPLVLGHQLEGICP
jgi:hypothetical protein